MNHDQLRRDAWIGDAVLALHARLFILTTHGSIDAAQASRMTSNQFLSTFGEPTAVEARIGRIYTEQGLDAAFSWIDAQLLPAHQRRETKISRHG